MIIDARRSPSLSRYTADRTRIVAMQPATQGLPVHAILFRNLGSHSAFRHQREGQKAADRRIISALACETPRLHRYTVQTADWDRGARLMPPSARIASRASSQSTEEF
jgi:hypothetical protein